MEAKEVLVWTPELEVSLFHSMKGHKPIGKNEFDINLYGFRKPQHITTIFTCNVILCNIAGMRDSVVEIFVYIFSITYFYPPNLSFG